MAAALCLGFSAGLPLALTGGTLQAWMTDAKVDLTVIGIFALVGLPYTLKFVWSPLMDRYVPPFLGRRRGWLLITQLALVVTISAMAFSDPAEAPGVLAAIALLVAFSSASQDIVIDAHRAEILKPDEWGAGAGVYIMGYRIAMIVSSALALMMAEYLPWRVVYLIMAATLSVGIVTTLLTPEPQGGKPPKSIEEAVVLPFKDFFGRKGALEIVLFIILYKVDVAMTQAMMTPFILQLGFTKFDIGAVTKGFGLAATIVGTLAGGAMLAKVGIHKGLWTFGILQGIAGLSFTALAILGKDYPMMVTAIAAENFFSGMGNAAYAAFMMSLCNKSFTATQYALLTSLMALTRVFIAVPTGWLAKNVGWETYFIIATVIMVPGLALLTRYKTWTTPKS
jgi:PAT family beta-lactamase induction signal transducer AmpG